MNKRNLRLDKYGISSKRYKELCGFCEQYPEWKREIMFDDGTPKSPVISDMPRPPLNNSDKVGDLAIRHAENRHKCTLIENTAKEADSEFWQDIIRNVCYETSIDELSGKYEMPLSKTAFYERRRYFFYLLDRRKN